MRFNTRQILTTVVISLIISFGCSRKSEGLKQSDIEPLINTFLAMHVSHNNFDSEISARTLDNLLSMLDPWKMYFTKSDIDQFMQDKGRINEYVQNGDFDFLFKLYAKYRARSNERFDLINQLMKLDYDFTVDESISVDRNQITYTDNPAELRERWRKTIKLQLLGYINTGKPIAEAKQKVAKKYELAQKELQAVTNEKIFTIFVNAFGLALDPHTDYMDADEYEDFAISMNLKLEGIGAILRSEDGFTFVESIMPGGPASKLPDTLKLMPNDKIIAVAQESDEAENIIDMPLRDAVNRIRGKKGSTVKLTVIREVEKGKTTQLTIPIVRDKIVLENQAAKSELYQTTRGSKTYKIGYISLPTFYADGNSSPNDPNAKYASRDLLNEINKMTSQGAEALVVDLRGNPGGALSEAIRTAGFFIKDGPIVQVKSHEKIRVESDDDPKMYYDGPVVVLIDKMSASASEIFAGALKDYRRALIVGYSSFGKGSVQNLIPLGGRNGAMKVTIQLFYQPSGNSNHLNGIHPDITIVDLPDILDIGENKLKYPLEWTPIKKAFFETFGNKYVSPEIVSTLSSRSQTRMKSDKDFVALTDKIEKYRKKISESVISLKKDTLTSETINDEVTKQVKPTDKGDTKKKVIDTQRDLLLREALQITVDYIDLLKKKP
jgi:carboxyl-terminal processing protease